MNFNTFRRTALSSSTFKTFTMFSISLFLLIMLLSAFYVVPKFNYLLDSQHSLDVENELAQEAALFSRFIVSQQSLVQDLASSPSLTSAVMLGDANDLAITELFDNTVIGGEKSRLVLQDIEAKILIKTPSRLYGNYTGNQDWVISILNGSKPYHFQLLRQDNDLVTFKVSVPVFYNRFIEGVLSSEITMSLNELFVTQSFKDNVAFKLTQDGVTIHTGAEYIELHRENSVTLAGTNIVFTYITDDSLIYNDKRSLQNTILLVLLSSFTIGFILFSALNYRTLTGKKATFNSKLSLWKTYAIPVLVGGVGIAASISGFQIASNLKEAVIEKEQIFESQQKIASISKKIDLNLQILDSVTAFYQASNYVSREEFTTFIKPLLKSYQNIITIEWIPLVSTKTLTTFEQNAKNDGLEDFIIKERSSRGVLIPVSKRATYFPVFYIEPQQGNEGSLGFDLSSNSHFSIPMDKAKVSGDRVATSKITIPSELGLTVGIHVFNPVFKKNQMSDISQPQELQGFLLTTLNVGDIFTETLNEATGNLLLYIEDVTNPNNTEDVFGVKEKNSNFFREELVNVGGRSWRIVTYNNTNKTPLMFSAWLVLIAGLILTSLITMGILYLIRRHEVVERLVASRTQELRSSEEQYRSVVENAVDGLITIDEFGIVEKYNRAAETIFGYHSDEIIGKDIKILMPAMDHDGQDSYMKDYRNSGVKKDLGIDSKVKGRRKDGTIFPIDLSISEVTLGNTRKLTGIVRDVTERVALEKERDKFIEKLTDSNEELARFAYVCSHDLQEPLRMVRSFSEMLQNHLAQTLKDDAKGQKYFNFVIDGATRSQTLITDILAYSSISNDTLMFEDVDLAKVVGVISAELCDSASGMKGKVTCDDLPKLQGNKTQLFQLFQNLISNGLKYQKADATPHVHIGVEDQGKYWLFTVKDNGIGMEHRHFTKIFEVFQRLHGRSKYAGTGVGLSICKKVVERHGGTIWVESQKDVGSTFFVKLLKPNYIEELL